MLKFLLTQQNNVYNQLSKEALMKSQKAKQLNNNTQSQINQSFDNSESNAALKHDVSENTIETHNHITSSINEPEKQEQIQEDEHTIPSFKKKPKSCVIINGVTYCN
jgi:hypothetical protein